MADLSKLIKQMSDLEVRSLMNNYVLNSNKECCVELMQINAARTQATAADGTVYQIICRGHLTDNYCPVAKTGANTGIALGDEFPLIQITGGSFLRLLFGLFTNMASLANDLISDKNGNLLTIYQPYFWIYDSKTDQTYFIDAGSSGYPIFRKPINSNPIMFNDGSTKDGSGYYIKNAGYYAALDPSGSSLVVCRISYPSTKIEIPISGSGSISWSCTYQSSYCSAPVSGNQDICNGDGCDCYTPVYGPETVGGQPKVTCVWKGGCISFTTGSYNGSESGSYSSSVEALGLLGMNIEFAYFPSISLETDNFGNLPHQKYIVNLNSDPKNPPIMGSVIVPAGAFPDLNGISSSGNSAYSYANCTYSTTGTYSIGGTPADIFGTICVRFEGGKPLLNIIGFAQFGSPFDEGKTFVVSDVDLTVANGQLSPTIGPIAQVGNDSIFGPIAGSVYSYPGFASFIRDAEFSVNFFTLPTEHLDLYVSNLNTPDINTGQPKATPFSVNYGFYSGPVPSLVITDANSSTKDLNFFGAGTYNVTTNNIVISPDFSIVATLPIVTVTSDNQTDEFISADYSANSLVIGGVSFIDSNTKQKKEQIFSLETVINSDNSITIFDAVDVTRTDPTTDKPVKVFEIQIKIGLNPSFTAITQTDARMRSPGVMSVLQINPAWFGDGIIPGVSTFNLYGDGKLFTNYIQNLVFNSQTNSWSPSRLFRSQPTDKTGPYLGFFNVFTIQDVHDVFGPFIPAPELLNWVYRER